MVIAIILEKLDEEEDARQITVQNMYLIPKGGKRKMTYKNHKGYLDPTQEQATEHMSWEELQRMREKKHHLCRGQKIIVETMQRPEGKPTARMIKVRTKYYVVEFYKHCILLRNKKGILSTPPYTKLKLMMQGAEADE